MFVTKTFSDINALLQSNRYSIAQTDHLCWMGHLRIRHLARTNRNALGGKGFGRNIFVAHGGKILAISVFHSPVRFLFFFFFCRAMENPPTSAAAAWLRPWLSTPGSVFTSLVVGSGLHWAGITHCTTICAILTIDDLEKKGGVSMQILPLASHRYYGARQRQAVDVFPRGDSEV